MKLMRLIGGMAVLSLAVGQLAAQGPPKSGSASQEKTVADMLGKTLEQCIKDMRDPDPSIRQTAVRNLILYGPTARKAGAKALILCLKDTDDGVRSAAITMVGMMGPEPPPDAKDGKNSPTYDPAATRDPADTREIVRLLTQLLQSPQGVIRFQAANALGRLAHEAKAAIPQLASTTIRDSSSWEIRHAAVAALGRISWDKEKGPDIRAVTALANQLSDPCLAVRREVVQSLMMIGVPPDPAAITTLKSMINKHALKDRDKGVQIWSRTYLMRLDKTLMDDKNLTVLAEYIKDKDPGVVVEAIQALTVFGTDARSKIPDIAAALNRDEPPCVWTALLALASFGTFAEKTLPQIQAIAQSHKEESFRKLAREVALVVEGKKKEVSFEALMPPKEKDKP